MGLYNINIMGQISYNGKVYNMSMKEFYLMKNAKEIVDKLLNNPELLDEFNKQMRKAKLDKLKNKIDGN